MQRRPARGLHQLHLAHGKRILLGLLSNKQEEEGIEDTDDHEPVSHYPFQLISKKSCQLGPESVQGVKRDRGLNISFTKDIILPPGGYAGGKATTNGANVALSFKDNKNAYRCSLAFTSTHDVICILSTPSPASPGALWSVPPS